MTQVLVNGAQAGSDGVEMVQNKKNCTPDHFTVPLNGAITPKNSSFSTGTGVGSVK